MVGVRLAKGRDSRFLRSFYDDSVKIIEGVQFLIDLSVVVV